MISSFGSLEITLVAFLSLYGNDLRVAETMAKKLGSEVFAERNAAESWFRARPITMQVLERSIRDSDAETKRRAQVILEFHSQWRTREIQRAIEAGQFDRAVELLSKWPKGEREDDAWAQTVRLVKKLATLSRQKNDAIRLSFDSRPNLQCDAVVGHFPAETKVRERATFFRGNEAIWRTSSKQYEAHHIWATVSGPVDLSAGATSLMHCAIFARESVIIRNEKNIGLVVVSSGDVEAGGLSNCLIIARGKITCDTAINCHLIAGQSVTSRYGTAKCLISENDLNPLGFIRWDDAPKEKARPKPK
jgi:hypothetical protein